MRNFLFICLAALLELPVFMVLSDAVKELYGITDWKCILVVLALVYSFDLGEKILRDLRENQS